MRVRFGSWFLCQMGRVGFEMKLVLLSDNGSGIRLTTAGAGRVQVYQTGPVQDSGVWRHTHYRWGQSGCHVDRHSPKNWVIPLLGDACERGF